MTRIASTLPEARMIVSLRNPVDRAWSQYWLLRERGVETRSFSEAIEDEVKRLAEQGAGAGGVFYLLHGLYDVHLRRLYEHFDRTAVFVSIFERMTEAPRQTYAELCEFLGIDSAYVPDNIGEPVNAYVRFRSLPVRRAAQRIGGPIGRLAARLNTIRSSAPQMSTSDRQRVVDFYASRRTALRELLGEIPPEWD